MWKSLDIYNLKEINTNNNIN